MPRTLCLCWKRTSRSSDLLPGHQQAMRRAGSSATGRDSRWPSAARTPYHGYGVTASRFNLQHPDDGSVCRVCARRPQRHSRTNPKVPKTPNSTFGKPTVTGIHQDDGPRRRKRREAKGCSPPSQISSASNGPIRRIKRWSIARLSASIAESSRNLLSIG